MCFGGTAATGGQVVNTGTQSVGGHTFNTAYTPPVSSYGTAAYNGIPWNATTNASYRAPANYFLTPQARVNPSLPLGNYNTYKNTTGGKSIPMSAKPTAVSGESMLQSFNPSLSRYTTKSTTSNAPSLLNRIGGYLKDPKTLDTLGGLAKQFAPMLSGLIKNPKDTSMTSADARTMLEGKSATAEGAAARAKMLEYINNPEKIGGVATENYVKALNADHDYSDAATLAKFDSDWVAQGYNTTGSDYFRAKADLQTKLNNARNTEIGAAQAALYQTQLTAQLNMISQQYGIEMQLLVDLVNMDIQSAADKYGMKIKEVDDFRKAIQSMLGVSATQEQA